jgi:septal ring factor EnvC (AmiA/AmiB activator)
MSGDTPAAPPAQCSRVRGDLLESEITQTNDKLTRANEHIVEVEAELKATKQNLADVVSYAHKVTDDLTTANQRIEALAKENQALKQRPTFWQWLFKRYFS